MRSPNLSPEAKKLAHAFSGTDELGNHPGMGGMHLMERGLNDWRRGNKAPQRLLTEKEAEYFGMQNIKDTGPVGCLIRRQWTWWERSHPFLESCQGTLEFS
jgi:hypothetical protein